MYIVTYAIDSLDPNPIVQTFDEFWEAEDFLHEEVELRVSWIVEHSAYSITESELDDIREIEYSLAKLEKVEE